jgi:hypothetical protein
LDERESDTRPERDSAGDDLQSMPS